MPPGIFCSGPPARISCSKVFVANTRWSIRCVNLCGPMQEFQKKLENFTDYYKTFQTIIDNCKVYFTPQPMFFETTTEWAATLPRNLQWRRRSGST